MQKISIEICRKKKKKTKKDEKTCENINFWYNIEMNKKSLKFGRNE